MIPGLGAQSRSSEAGLRLDAAGLRSRKGLLLVDVPLHVLVVELLHAVLLYYHLELAHLHHLSLPVVGVGRTEPFRSPAALLSTGQGGPTRNKHFS